MPQFAAAALAASTLALAATIAAPLSAQIVEFRANLTGSQQNPPVATPATGTATLFYNVADRTFTIRNVFSGLLTPTTVAHIHGGAVGINGPVLFDLLPPVGVTSGDFTRGPFTASLAQQTNLFAGNWYVNIHTQGNPGGEIRGQLFATVPEPSTYLLMATGLTALAIAAHRRRA